MVAVSCRFANPQFADYAAFGKNVLHSEGLLDIVVNQTSSSPPPLAAGMTTFVACTLESHHDVVAEQNFGKSKH
jgi:hypothetical protein